MHHLWSVASKNLQRQNWRTGRATSTQVMWKIYSRCTVNLSSLYTAERSVCMKRVHSLLGTVTRKQARINNCGFHFQPPNSRTHLPVKSWVYSLGHGLQGKLSMQKVFQDHSFPFAFRGMQTSHPSFPGSAALKHYNPFRNFSFCKQDKKIKSKR